MEWKSSAELANEDCVVAAGLWSPPQVWNPPGPAPFWEATLSGGCQRRARLVDFLELWGFSVACSLWIPGIWSGRVGGSTQSQVVLWRSPGMHFSPHFPPPPTVLERAAQGGLKHWQILTEVKVTVGPFSLNLLRNDWLAVQRDGQLDLHKQHRPFLKLSFKTSNSFYHPLVSFLVPTSLQLFLFPIIEFFSFPFQGRKKSIQPRL